MSTQGNSDGNSPPNVVDIASLDTYTILSVFLGLLAERAWQTMGLRAKPGTDKIETDLQEAKTAIDTVSFLVEKLQARLPDEERRRLEGLIADLKLNYVRLAKA